MNKQAVRRIVLAQVASDGGKGITDLLDMMPNNIMPAAQRAWNSGYAVKDKLLEQACAITACHKNSDVHFFVTEDKQSIAKFIVYFDVKIEDKRWQVSFHSFSNRWAKWAKSTVASRGHWDHKSSREACVKMLQLL